MGVNAEGLAIIKQHEGLRLTAYYCPAGVLTIGYGHTGSDVTPGRRIDEATAEALLIGDVARFEQVVRESVKVPLNENQFSALVSFVYNIGPGAFQKSSLLRFLNLGEYTVAANQFGNWVFAGKRRLAGLEKRRAAEKALFLKAKQ